MDLSLVQNVNFYGELKKIENSGFPITGYKERPGSWSSLRFTAHKGHVSIHGMLRKGLTTNTSWSNVRVRSINGGYKSRKSYSNNLDDTITMALHIYNNEEALKVPKFNPGELPDPYEFDNDLKITKGGPGVVHHETNMRVRCCHVASFNEKLFVSGENIMDPDRDAWFVFAIEEGNASQRERRIITTGETWLPLRKSTKKRWRVAFDKPFSLNHIDKLMINTAIQTYVAHHALA